MKAEIRDGRVVIIAETLQEKDFLNRWFNKNVDTPGEDCIGRHGAWEMIIPTNLK